MGAVILAGVAGIGLGVFLTWGAAQARIREMEWQQDNERLQWQTLTRWQLESQRLGYGIGEAAIVTPSDDVLPMRQHQQKP